MSNNQRPKTVSLFTAGVITTISITLVLFLLGSTLLVGLTGKGFTSYLKENMAISIELSDSIDEKEIAKMQKELSTNPYIKSTVYVSKEQIKKQLIEDLGRDPEEISGYTPPHVIDVFVKAEYVNVDSIKKVEQSLKGVKLINKVDYSEDDISMANSNLSKIGSLLLILAVLLIIISFTLIRNTIQLHIYSKRFLINTMRLVGATNGFIRRPFMASAIVSSIVAAILANLLITGVAYYFVSEFPDLISMVEMVELLIVYAAVFVLGILITILATISAINRYLRMASNKLYHI